MANPKKVIAKIKESRTSHAERFQLKTNVIYVGDNIKMLHEIPDNSVDLIYIDPPFNSNRDYEVFWGDIQEKRAFEDRFGDADAYIQYMRPRVVELHRVLKETGTFYYHCDWHASHYVKIMLDQIFDFNNFRNEIVWKRSTTRSSISKVFRRAHDTIFFYSKSKKYFFNMQYSELSEGSKKLYENKDERGFYQTVPLLVSGKRNGKTGQVWNGIDPNKQGVAGMHWVTIPEKLDKYEKDGLIHFPKDGTPRLKYYLNQSPGSPMSDFWDDIKLVQGGESLGYPTQKPIALLERILNASSDKDFVVLDAFCGCGTTLIAAQKLGRKWIGIDISPTACRVMSDRLWEHFKLDEGKDFVVISLYQTEEDLLRLPPFEFQNWAVVTLGGIPNRIKVNDFGIDGKLYPVEIEKKKKHGDTLFGEMDIYYPIQVKQKAKAGRPDIDHFETAIRRDGRRKGYFVAFDFSEDAIKEMKRLDKEGEIEIIPIRVSELLKKEQEIR